MVLFHHRYLLKNVEEKLRDKVRRNNNLTIEIQGAVIITRKIKI